MIPLTIVFDSPEKLHAFMRWLDSQGEQDYYGWVQIVDPDQEVDTFEYDYQQHLIITMKG